VHSKAIFLDRDGTINKEVNYLTDKKDIEILDGVIEALANFKKKGYLNIIITNQSAVARGLLTIEQLTEIHDEFLKIITLNGTPLIDDIFFSPYHTEGVIEEFKIDSDDRKPGIGMIKKAAEKYYIDLNSSFLIGDSYVDMKCAGNAGLKKIMVLTGYGKNELIKCKKENIFIEYVANNFFDVQNYILKHTNSDL
jgi:D-glycero-D-manno-heptose 1,7-bisphosphate phosphatase